MANDYFASARSQAVGGPGISAPIPPSRFDRLKLQPNLGQYTRMEYPNKMEVERYIQLVNSIESQKDSLGS